jgi:hypothetical protein
MSQRVIKSRKQFFIGPPPFGDDPTPPTPDRVKACMMVMPPRPPAPMLTGYVWIGKPISGSMPGVGLTLIINPRRTAPQPPASVLSGRVMLSSPNPRHAWSFPPAFRLYNQATGEIIADIQPGDRTLDLTGILPDGQWTLGLTRVDVYGNESIKATIRTRMSGGAASAGVISPTRTRARIEAAGVVVIGWDAIPADGQADAVSFELASVQDPDTILATVTQGETRRYSYTLTAGHGQTVRLMVRSVGEDGARSVWVPMPVVVADAQGPQPPELVPTPPPPPAPS